jgi:hypothetical protein
MAINTIYIDGDNSQLRQVIFDATPTAIEQTKSIALQFKGGSNTDTCKNIFDFLHTKIMYRADGWHQQVKLPSALLREKVGDCKSYSVFTYAILYNLGIGCKYVLTSYSQDPTPSHIYVVTDDGIIIDAVWGKFNSEKPSTFKYYKKINNVKISTITGIKGNTPKQVSSSTLIGCSQCETKIGEVQAMHVGWKSKFSDGIDWYNAIQEQGKGKPKLSAGSKAEWYTKKAGLGLFRVAFLQFIKANAGGIATSMYNNIFREVQLFLPIPPSANQELSNNINAYIQKVGVKFPTRPQHQEIQNKANVRVETIEAPSPKNNFKGVYKTTASMNPEDAWDSVMGKGQYKIYGDYTNFLETSKEKLKNAYSIPPATKESKDKYYNGLQPKWFWLGGNPDELTEAIIDGATKSPRGKSANYMLMIAKTRGLEAKDLGLILRGFVSGFAGDKFSWGSSDTYIFGTEQRIGLTGAEVGAWVTANLPLIITLFRLIKGIFDASARKEEAKKQQAQINTLLESGWVYEKDYFSMDMPRPKVSEVKQFDLPTNEIDYTGLLNIGLTLAQGGTQAEALKIQASQDPNTSSVLQKINALGSSVQPKEGNKLVTLIRVNTNALDTGSGAMGGLILPIGIGLGVLLLLRK